MKKIYIVIIVLFLIVVLLSCLYLKEDVMISESSNISFINDSDIIGSIKIKSINFSNILLQGLDNEYYLEHDYKKNTNSNGEIFLDYQGDLINNKNTIIYSKKNNLKGINNIKVSDKIEIYYINKTICYKVINKNQKSTLEIRVISGQKAEKIFAKKVKC